MYGHPQLVEDHAAALSAATAELSDAARLALTGIMLTTGEAFAGDVVERLLIEEAARLLGAYVHEHAVPSMQ